MTGANNDRDKTFAWIENFGAEYPFAFAKDDTLSKAVGVKGIPHAALFDPEGKLLWSGSPYNLNKGTIKDALKGASKSITFGWGKPFADVAKDVMKNDFGSALGRVDALAAKGTEGADDVRTSVVRKLDRKVQSMESALESGDYHAALVVAESLEGNLDGLEQEAAVTSTLEKLESDEEIETVLEGQKKLAKITGGKLKKTREVESAIAKAEKLADKYGGTIVETQAKAFVQRMKARLAAKK